MVAMALRTFRFGLMSLQVGKEASDMALSLLMSEQVYYEADGVVSGKSMERRREEC